MHSPRQTWAESYGGEDKVDALCEDLHEIAEDGVFDQVRTERLIAVIERAVSITYRTADGIDSLPGAAARASETHSCSLMRSRGLQCLLLGRLTRHQGCIFKAA